MPEWWNTPYAAWGFLALSIGGGGVLAFLSPQIGIPICVVLIIIGILLIIRAYRYRDKFMNKLKLELGQETISELYDIREQLLRDGIQVGGGGSTQKALERLCLYEVVERRDNPPNPAFPGLRIGYWFPNKTGKSLIRYLESRPPTSHKEGYSDLISFSKVSLNRYGFSRLLNRHSSSLR